MLNAILILLLAAAVALGYAYFPGMPYPAMAMLLGWALLILAGLAVLIWMGASVWSHFTRAPQKPEVP